MTRALPLLLGLVLVHGALAQDADARARRLSERLIAPCCWNETLDTHASPLATELRQEIRARLAAGQSEAAIEQDLVTRYGERIRAVPREGEPMAIAIFIAGGLALIGLVLLGLRWSRASRRREQAAPPPRATTPEEDARLERELEALEDT
ncbi:MAG: cytochrome c-type biogenesis protein CcmH [Sandaracinaceae bacterium]|nr:cytochrome c-type biogenesis protein CcmH [Sandaracinaceae bacterium]